MPLCVPFSGLSSLFWAELKKLLKPEKGTQRVKLDNNGVKVPDDQTADYIIKC